MSIERILMPTDFSSCAEAAFDRALALAKEHDAELHVLHVVELHALDMAGVDPAFPDLEDVHRRLEALAESEIGRRLEHRRESVLVIQEAVRRGVAAAPAIGDYAREQGVDLIVLGTHGRRGLRRWILGSVAEEVVRTASCPVLMIPTKEAPETVRPFSHIVVPHDFSSDSDRALERACDLVVAGGDVDVVHVIPPPMAAEMYAPLSGLNRDLDVVGLRSEVQAQLADRIAGTTSPERSVAPHVLNGHAASAIVDFADRVDADLIVVGSHGFSGVERFLLGSVSAGVIRAASMPVLTVRDGRLAGVG